MSLKRADPMKLIPSLSKCTLLISGWVLFLLSWFLPRSIRYDDAFSEDGIVWGWSKVFYSFLSIMAVFEKTSWDNIQVTFYVLAYSIIGLLNILMLVVPALLFLKGKSASAIITFGALYICTIGFLIERGDPLLFGHYVWCLSFIVVAATLNFTSSKD